jgi:hypothetical protein
MALLNLESGKVETSDRSSVRFSGDGRWLARAFSRRGQTGRGWSGARGGNQEGARGRSGGRRAVWLRDLEAGSESKSTMSWIFPSIQSRPWRLSGRTADGKETASVRDLRSPDCRKFQYFLKMKRLSAPSGRKIPRGRFRRGCKKKQG